MRSKPSLRFILRYGILILLPMMTGIGLVLIGGVETGTELREALGNPAWSSFALPFGMLLLVYGVFVSAKLTSQSSARN